MRPSASTLISVNKSVIACDMEQVSGSHRREIGMKIVPAESLPRLGNGGLDECNITNSSVSAEVL